MALPEPPATAPATNFPKRWRLLIYKSQRGLNHLSIVFFCFFSNSPFFLLFFLLWFFFLFVEGLNWPKKLARLAKWTAFRFKAGFGPRKRWTSFWLELNQLFIRQVCVAIMVQQFFADSPKSNIHHFSFDWNCNYECFSLVFLGGGGGGGDGSAA